MAIRNIVQISDATLRKKSFEVTEFNEKLHLLLDDMRETLLKAEGVGLAAPQVGVLRRVFIVMYENYYFECVNPKITEMKGKCVDTEGCLSVKGKSGEVERPTKIKIEFFDRFGNLKCLSVSGFLARIFCHEYDHLDGILYVDKAKNIQG